MSSRGHNLESALNRCNLYYRKNKIALIEKKPLPVELTKEGAIIKQSTVDYTGLVGPNGRAIAFDAKETKIETSFPLSNIHQHQLTFLKYWKEMGGISFFLIHFTKVHPDHAYYADIDWVWKYYEDGYINNTGRKSIPISDFKDEWLIHIHTYLESLLQLLSKDQI